MVARISALAGSVWNDNRSLADGVSTCPSLYQSKRGPTWSSRSAMNPSNDIDMCAITDPIRYPYQIRRRLFPSTGGDLHQVVLEGEERGAGPGLDADLPVHVDQVGMHGGIGNVEGGGGLLVGIPAGEHPEDVDLAVRQSRRPGAIGAPGF